MSITLCIPCYRVHLQKLVRCFDSIEAQTVKPAEVIVSCSSSRDEDIPVEFSTTRYTFPYKIVLTQERKNAAQNRNIAASLATTPYVSFFDADDILHPQRIEFITEALKQYPNTDIILHGYRTVHEPEGMISTPIFHQNQLQRAPSGCAIYAPNWRLRIHHAQVTTTKAIWDQVRFREDAQHERKEDAVFCGDVLALPGIQSVYIPQALSIYEEEGQTYAI